MHTQSPFQWLARSGYAARGIVYVLVAGIALFSSFGSGKPDSKSALHVVLEQPLGRFWLGLIALGLLGFIAWRLAQAFGNADGHPPTAKGYGTRFGLLVSALVYTSLAIYASSVALGIGSKSGSGGETGLSAWLIEQPFGRYLLAGVGLATIGAGIAQILKGTGRGYTKYLDIPHTAGTAIDWICMYGLAARGIILVITGVFFLYAAFVVDPGQAGGISDALDWVRQLPFGAILYVAVAIGLFAFGLYGFVESAYRRIRPPTIASSMR
ncbi:DUF1206 domain-containing protein [Pararhizobium qamdonense]|uniref:DUF1206 domain-containing protein n=1 Tax=Pararhizobium qamdonense TaxID=3031126 RepID=UPI0023E1DB92|nr:DUF1206 domain-containing protein [Pararhizobium qamdonense]